MTAWCKCDRFDLWYEELAGDIWTTHRVCRCGHRDIEHLDKTRSCIGYVEVSPGQKWPPLYKSWKDMVDGQTLMPGDPTDHLSCEAATDGA